MELKDKDLSRHKKEKERLKGDWYCSRYKAVEKGGEEFFEFLQLQFWPSDFLKGQKKGGGSDLLVKSKPLICLTL